jgi:hypothetical protein
MLGTVLSTYDLHRTRSKRFRMKKLLVLIAIALFCTATLSVAGKIYKWTDSEGNIHYGERPPNGQGQQIHVPTAPPAPASPAATPSSQVDTTKNLLDAFDKERKDKQEAADKIAKEKETRDKNCSNARKRIAGLKMGGRQYEVTEQGERHYLDDAAIQQRLTEAQKAADEWCK